MNHTKVQNAAWMAWSSLSMRHYFCAPLNVAAVVAAFSDIADKAWSTKKAPQTTISVLPTIALTIK